MSLFITQLHLDLEYIFYNVYFSNLQFNTCLICYRYNNIKQKVTIVCIFQIVKQIFQQYILKHSFF